MSAIIRVIFVVMACSIFSLESFSSADPSNNSKPFVLIIDPGHGGKDPGAENKSIREKDIVLGIGLKLGNLIKENHPHVKIVFTRSTDVFVPLIDRSKIANKNKADLFISLHANSCGSPSIRGTETFVLGLDRSNENLEVAKKENSVILLEEDYSTTYEGFDPNSPESYIMFELVQDIYMDQSLYIANALQKQFGLILKTPNRGVKQAGFLVLRQSSMPSVLIEAGFLSNQTEANYLNSQIGQQEIAQSIFEAFSKFLNKNSNAKNTQQTDHSTELTDKNPQNVAKETIQSLAPPIDAKIKQAEVTSTTNISTEKRENPKIQNENEVKTSKVYYCVQIGASTTTVDPTPANFKGLKNVHRDKIDKYYRYYVGKEDMLKNAESILLQVKTKFPQAFIVSFVNGERVLIK